MATRREETKRETQETIDGWHTTRHWETGSYE